MYVTFLLDVEDIIVPEADDVARDVARILTDEGVKATFCIVGERVRQWQARGRTDVLEALSRHDIGSHTDYHSVHPTVVEYIGSSDWATGCSEVVRRESPAVEAIRGAFGLAPSCWGGPGNTWAPQINAAMASLGVPAIVYAHTQVPHGDVHRFSGAISYPCGHHAGDSDYADDGKSLENLHRLQAQLRSDIEAGCRWREVFLGHPTRILHEEFWDGPNFSLGKNPPSDAWVRPRRKREDDLDRALANLRRTVSALRDMQGITLKTIREMNALALESPSTPLNASEIDAVKPTIEANLRSMAGWVILPLSTDVTPIVQSTMERLDTLERISLPAD
jgi:hypothetical protein